MISSLIELSNELVTRALRRGADAADAISVRRQSVEVAVRDAATEKLERAESREAGLRLFIGGASAIVSGSVLDSEGLDRLVETAISMARTAPPDPFAGIAEPGQLSQNVVDLDLEAKDLPSPQQLEQWALEAESAAMAVRGVTKSSGASASTTHREMALATSAGFTGAYSRTSLSVGMSAIAGQSTAMERDYEYSTGTHPSALKSPEEIGRKAGERAVRRLNPRKIKSQSMPVIYENRVAASLVGHLLTALLGNAVARRASFLQDCMGETILPRTIDIIDDPLIVRGLGSRPFDAEGLAGRARRIVDGGVLKTWLLDLRSARQLNLEPTGHASRGLSSPPSPSSTNAYMANGDVAAEALIADVGKGLFVTELIGMGVNAVTGDYSRGASGFWIENGEITWPVSEITIAGNLKDMFRNLQPANDLEFRGTTNAPTMRVEGLTVAGA